MRTIDPVLEITMEALISRYDVLLFDAFGVLAGRYPHCNNLRFQLLGKPHRGPFEAACLRSGTRNMVMIGDQLETDIQGIRTLGIDAVWVRPAKTRNILAAVPTHWRPTFILKEF